MVRLNPWVYEKANHRVTRLNFSKNFLKRILVHAELFGTIILCRPNIVLEVGSGSLIHSHILSYLGIKCIGIDINIASKKIYINEKRFGKKKTEFILADAFNLPFKKNSFDIIFSS